MIKDNQIKTERIDIERVKPGRYTDIFLYLITLGRIGRLWDIEIEPMNRFYPSADDRVNLNCRCVSSPSLNGETKIF